MSWPAVQLSFVADVAMGQSPPGNTYNESGEGLPFFQGKAEFGRGHPTIKKWCTAPSRTAEKGDILLSVRAPVGPTNIAPDRCCIGRGLAAIRAKPHLVEQGYIRHFFKYIEPVLSRQGQGSTFAAINRREIEQLQVPLPPLLEQRRIIEILDQADTLHRKNVEVSDKEKRILPALFMRIFDSDLQQENFMSLGEIALEFRYGTSTRSSDQGYPTLRIPNVVGGRFDLSEIKFVPVPKKEFERLNLQKGDMLVVRTNGNPNYVGRSVVFEEEAVNGTGLKTDQFIYASYLIRIRINTNFAEPWFVQTYLSLPEGRRALRERCQTSAGQYNININALASIPVPDVPIERQKEFVEHVQTIRRLRSHRLELSRHLDCASSSLLHRAFSGELTAKWRDARVDELSRQVEEQTEALRREHPTDSNIPRRRLAQRLASC